MTANYTCETCWCVILTKFRARHEAWHKHNDDDAGRRA